MDGKPAAVFEPVGFTKSPVYQRDSAMTYWAATIIKAEDVRMRITEFGLGPGIQGNKGKYAMMF